MTAGQSKSAMKARRGDRSKDSDSESENDDAPFATVVRSLPNLISGLTNYLNQPPLPQAQAEQQHPTAVVPAVSTAVSKFAKAAAVSENDFSLFDWLTAIGFKEDDEIHQVRTVSSKNV